MVTVDTRQTEMFVKVEISTDLVRVITLDGARNLLLMWDMTPEQYGTLRAIMDCRWDEYRESRPALPA